VSDNIAYAPWCANSACSSLKREAPCHFPTLPYIIAGGAGAFVLFVILMGVWLRQRSNRRIQLYHVTARASERSKLIMKPKIKDLQDLKVEFIPPKELEIQDVIGTGAFGAVFKALWKSKNLIVAVKKMAIAPENSASVDAFIQEIKIMNSLDHPNILSLLGVSIASPASNDIFLVTEYMSKGSLATLLHKSKIKLTYSQKLHIAKEVAYGMHYLHSISPPIVHRDLKTDNILLNERGTCKVADFGISRILKKYTKTMTAKGTPDYMAPESILSGQFSEKSDVYGFGMILWELYTQERPYKDVDNPMQVMIGVAKEGLKPTIPSECPPDFAKLLNSCLEHDPDTRISFKQVIDILKDMSEENDFWTGQGQPTVIQ